jgi:hypothetical protein
VAAAKAEGSALGPHRPAALRPGGLRSGVLLPFVSTSEHRSASPLRDGAAAAELLLAAVDPPAAWDAPADGAWPMWNPVIRSVLTAREAGTPVGNPIVVTVRAGMQPVGRGTRPTCGDALSVTGRTGGVSLLIRKVQV